MIPYLQAIKDLCDESGGHLSGVLVTLPDGRRAVIQEDGKVSWFDQTDTGYLKPMIVAFSSDDKPPASDDKPPASEGWLEWFGGPCPFKGEEARVEYWTRGREEKPGERWAHLLCWSHDPTIVESDNHITFYRLTTSPTGADQ